VNASSTTDAQGAPAVTTFIAVLAAETHVMRTSSEAVGASLEVFLAVPKLFLLA
jgi:hypothetical protein